MMGCQEDDDLMMAWLAKHLIVVLARTLGKSLDHQSCLELLSGPSKLYLMGIKARDSGQHWLVWAGC